MGELAKGVIRGRARYLANLKVRLLVSVKKIIQLVGWVINLEFIKGKKLLVGGVS